MTPVEIIRVFVASPGELAEERRLLEEVVNELNLTWGDTLGVRLELVKWETHAYPNFGADAQDVIDGQIGDNYDIFVGILSTKFGTPTRAAASGTEQEFGRAYSRYKRSPDELRIMFYFKEAAVTPAQFDAAQLLKVQEFKKELGQLGSLYWPFKTLDEFANLARVHLTRQVQTWRKSWGTRNKLVSEPAHEPVDAVQNRPYDQIADLGFLELVEVSQDSFRDLTDVAARIGSAVETLTGKMNRRTDEIRQGEALDESSRIRYYKRITKMFAEDMQDFCTRMEAEIPIFAKLYRTGTDAMARAASMLLEFEGDQRHVIEKALLPIRTLREKIKEPRTSITSFRDVVRKFPGVTGSFIKARDHIVVVLDNLNDEFGNALQHTTSLEQVLEEFPYTVCSRSRIPCKSTDTIVPMTRALNLQSSSWGHILVKGVWHSLGG